MEKETKHRRQKSETPETEELEAVENGQIGPEAGAEEKEAAAETGAEEKEAAAEEKEREAGTPEKMAGEKKNTHERLAELREQFRELHAKIQSERQAERAPFGEFKEYFTSHNKIELPPEKQEELERQLAVFQKENIFRGPRIFSGNKTATEYDNKISNFSTKTAIKELSTGEKIFVVDSYPASLIHRLGDSFLRRMAGFKSFKAPNSVWKETFERRSNIPTIKLKEKNAVAMPYVENVNLGDLMAFNKEIKNWGPAEWAKDVTLEDKKDIIKSAVAEIERIHRQGKTWGEAILPNMIIGKDKKVWICDPEVLFYKEVTKLEQKASDLKDVIFSASVSLAHSEGLKDYGAIVRTVLDNYEDEEVVGQVKKEAQKKPGFVQKLFFINTRSRYWPMKDFKMHEDIRRAIAKYGETG